MARKGGVGWVHNKNHALAGALKAPVPLVWQLGVREAEAQPCSSTGCGYGCDGPATHCGGAQGTGCRCGCGCDGAENGCRCGCGAPGTRCGGALGTGCHCGSSCAGAETETETDGEGSET